MNDENPYQSPLADLDRPAVGVLSGKRKDLRAVAIYQKGVLVCILLYLGGMIGQMVMQAHHSLSLPISLLCVGGVLVGALGGLVFVVLLAVKVYGTAIGSLLGILMFVPCIGLLVLLRVNAKATSVLRENGYRVGLLGARLSEFG